MCACVGGECASSKSLEEFEKRWLAARQLGCVGECVWMWVRGWVGGWGGGWRFEKKMVCGCVWGLGGKGVREDG